MKSKRVFAAIFAAATVILIACCCAFAVDPDASIKDITKPYACVYECKSATLDGEDLLTDYEYVRVTLAQNGELIVNCKKRDGGVREMRGNYTFDKKTRELKADMGILGAVYSHKTVIEGGKFVINMPIMAKQLTMIFESM